MREEVAEEDWITPEEKQAMDDLVAAISRGDMAARDRAVKKVRFLPSSLMAMKKVFGAEFIREAGLNTDLADKFYGPGWLDRKETKP